MKRKYFVSESWSQATVITKNHKLGIMLDPTPIHKNWDYRNFGDMFFDLKKDSLELDNKIGKKQYNKDIRRLRNYYDEFVRNMYLQRGKMNGYNKNFNILQAIWKIVEILSKRRPH
jgi:hypothetical protein